MTVKSCPRGTALFENKCVLLGGFHLSKHFKDKRYYKYRVSRKLTKTDTTVKPVRYATRRLYKDEKGQLWAVIDNKLWAFPQEIEH